MKSRLGFVRKTMGITYISELILLRKKMGVGQKVDQDERKVDLTLRQQIMGIE